MAKVAKEFALVGGKVVTHERVFDATVFVKDGKVGRVAEGHEPVSGMEQIDVSGKYILPGLIDMHVHFRVPGGEFKEDWETGSRAALAGGITTVFDMPNTNPTTTTVERLEEKRRLIAEKTGINFGLYAGATAENVDEVAQMKGIVGTKVYMGSSTGDLLLDDLGKLEEFMTKTEPLIVLHAENESCIVQHTKELEAELLGENGDVDPSIHSKIRDPECAKIAVRDALELAKKHKRLVHVTHLSTADEIALIRERKNDVDVTIDVTPHHLFLSDEDYEQYGTLLRVNPPVRDPADREALWQALEDGTVDMVGTDHAPHLLAEKQQPYGQAPSGLPGVQTMLPLLLTVVNEGRLTLERVVQLCSYGPAQRFGLSTKGEIAEGMDADITIVDMNLTEKVCHHFSWSKCGWSPFHGWMLKGWPVKTFVAGALCYEWRDTFMEGRGMEVTPRSLR